MGEFLLHLWRLSRPEIWLVSIVPMYVGWILASQELVPGLDVALGFATKALTEGATTREFWDAAWRFFLAAGSVVVAAIIVGPIGWAATLLINDAYDLASDRLNPRKAWSPIVRGIVSVRTAKIAAYAFAGLALVLALAMVGRVFALLTAAMLVLAWLYSVPPVRLKTRPGADVLVNALGVGMLAGLAGWSLARPVAEAPWAFLPQALVVTVAVYVPTTLVDYEADRAAGHETFATKLGRERAYRIGFGAWILGNVGAVLLSVLNVVIPRAMLPILLLFTPIMVWQYHAFIGRAESPAAMVNGIALCAVTFGAVCAIFALMFTGVWIA